ncbi:MAG: TauD/TfdA family dioxygenase, partial [Pseudolabrys sp.]
GMPEPDGRALIDELIAHATQRQFVYTHRWRVHDLVIWDDRCTMQRGSEFDDLRWKRDMQRATVSDVANSCEQEGIAVAAALGRRHNVRVGHLADMSVGCRMSAFGGKADMTWTGRGADDLPLHQNCGHEF